MSKVSIIIPSRNETWEVAPGVTVLQRMVRDIYEKATGDFEVLVTFDGPPYQELPNYPNLTRLDLKKPIGLRPSINKMAKLAKGKYIVKFDSHCMVGEGFDEILQQEFEDNWIVIPRMYVLDAERWKWQDDRHYDYFYLRCPLTDPKGFRFQAGGHWPERTQAREGKYDIDETMQLHGSCWMLTRDYFINKLGGMSTEGYEHFAMEPPELGLKTWLVQGGKVMVNKRTWYAHMHKGGQRPRGWPLTNAEIQRTYFWTANHWMRDAEPGLQHKLEWLIDRFAPVPTWPANWKELFESWLLQQ
jgi:glycosyltransferase involved in cell wall biosynthesis